ncbi:hypothetical protein [Mucilaginibacter lappiensis]|uniref:DoxX protein n=1 Tax=Mucilaginibacter lappiensis TaxID=354630 RepID=A0A1N7FFE5_9SPHI|nr:hypothetical protein [Mucilaginibacter lappiensis]MBB6112198.1 hypothetical protein [Mucilaginibacter lappiensis]MBB6129025.1 hypothetical protein [Mucilaginibacter lappiensis]SIR98955.1 hypothetical protein SAMN05421821_117147 [Mucilaginibacter lappiensis]
MKIAVIIGRSLLGLIYVLFGLSFFFHFIKIPAMPLAGREFQGALLKSGYFFQFLKITEITCGAFLLINRYTAFFLVIISPVTLNIFLFHVFLSPPGLTFVIMMLAINLFLGYAYRKYYHSVFTSVPLV